MLLATRIRTKSLINALLYIIISTTLMACGGGATTATSDEEGNVSDTTPPEIVLYGNTPQTISKGSTFTDQGATATDNIDGDLTSKIITGGDLVDTSITGEYTITYDVSDAAGNDAMTVIRTVLVVDNTTNSYSIGGTISGNSGEISLSLNGNFERFSSNTFTFLNKVDEEESYSVTVSNPPTNQTCSVSNGTGLATTNITNITVECVDDVLPSELHCSGFVATETHTVGNSLYEFVAPEGNCYGNKTGMIEGISKRELAIENVEIDSVSTQIEISSGIKITGFTDMAYTGNAGTNNNIGQAYLTFNVTNSSSEVYCSGSGAYVNMSDDSSNELFHSVTVAIWSDIYYTSTPTDELFKFYDNCIPPMQTRKAVGIMVTTPEQGVESLGVIQGATVFMGAGEQIVADSANYFPEALTPNEAVVTYTNIADTIYYQVSDFSFLNLTENPVIFGDSEAPVFFFDENDFLVAIYNTASIESYLGIDTDELTDNDYLVDAQGGMRSVRSRLLLTNSAATPNGASKATIKLSLCDNLISSVECKISMGSW